jgi:hypothetical protein
MSRKIGPEPGCIGGWPVLGLLVAVILLLTVIAPLLTSPHEHEGDEPRPATPIWETVKPLAIVFLKRLVFTVVMMAFVVVFLESVEEQPHMIYLWLVLVALLLVWTFLTLIAPALRDGSAPETDDESQSSSSLLNRHALQVIHVERRLALTVAHDHDPFESMELRVPMGQHERRRLAPGSAHCQL